jgi:hypothetical protein
MMLSSIDLDLAVVKDIVPELEVSRTSFADLLIRQIDVPSVQEAGRCISDK